MRELQDDGLCTERLYGLFVQSARVVTDSRKIVGGEMFFALRGEHFDGNQYAALALERGAQVAVVDDAAVAAEGDERYVVVKDVLEALQALSRHHRRQMSAKVIAITGTNGKTTTKELLSAVASRKFRTTHTLGNLNNHIGVPLTLLDIKPSHEVAIVEMGASAQGEIALLCSIAEPVAGIITNVGRAHLGGFGGQEGVRRGKGELYDYLARSGGEAFVREDDEVLMAMAAERADLTTIRYSTHLSDGIKHRLVGDYNRFNVAAAVAVGHYLGVAQEDIEAAIYDYNPTNGRSQELRRGDTLLTVDCYNANPSSMAVAIDNHSRLVRPDFPHKVLVLGDMLELGEWSGEEHRKVLESALASDAERVLLVGENFGALAADFNLDRITYCKDAAEAAEVLCDWQLSGAFVLVKGSRSMGLERVVEGAF